MNNRNLVILVTVEAASRLDFVEIKHAIAIDHCLHASSWPGNCAVSADCIGCASFGA